MDWASLTYLDIAAAAAAAAAALVQSSPVDLVPGQQSNPTPTPIIPLTHLDNVTAVSPAAVAPAATVIQRDECSSVGLVPGESPPDGSRRQTLRNMCEALWGPILSSLSHVLVHCSDPLVVSAVVDGYKCFAVASGVLGEETKPHPPLVYHTVIFSGGRSTAHANPRYTPHIEEGAPAPTQLSNVAGRYEYGRVRGLLLIVHPTHQP